MIDLGFTLFIRRIGECPDTGNWGGLPQNYLASKIKNKLIIGEFWDMAKLVWFVFLGRGGKNGRLGQKKEQRHKWICFALVRNHPTVIMKDINILE